MSATFFEKDDPEATARKEEERLLRSMGKKGGGGGGGGAALGRAASVANKPVSPRGATTTATVAATAKPASKPAPTPSASTTSAADAAAAAERERRLEEERRQQEEYNAKLFFADRTQDDVARREEARLLKDMKLPVTSSVASSSSSASPSGPAVFAAAAHVAPTPSTAISNEPKQSSAIALTETPPRTDAHGHVVLEDSHKLALAHHDEVARREEERWNRELAAKGVHPPAAQQQPIAEPPTTDAHSTESQHQHQQQQYQQPQPTATTTTTTTSSSNAVDSIQPTRVNKTGVLQEMSDGSGFMIDVGVMEAPREMLKVKLRNGLELQVLREVPGKTSSFRYELPFAFQPSLVAAEYTAADTRLVIKLLKQPSISSGAEQVLAQYSLPASGTAEKVAIGIQETKDHIVLKTSPSRYAEDVLVKLRDNKVVVWECKRTVEETDSKKIITATQTLKLPFETSPAAFALLQVPGDHPTLQLAKPTAATVPGEADIVIFSR